jgi:hypothetical protein
MNRLGNHLVRLIEMKSDQKRRKWRWKIKDLTSISLSPLGTSPARRLLRTGPVGSDFLHTHKRYFQYAEWWIRRSSTKIRTSKIIFLFQNKSAQFSFDLCLLSSAVIHIFTIVLLLQNADSSVDQLFEKGKEISRFPKRRATSLRLFHKYLLCFVKKQVSCSTLFKTSTRSVTTLKETILAQVPEKQKKLAALKKEHGKQVYVVCLWYSSYRLSMNSFIFSLLWLFSVLVKLLSINWLEVHAA